MNMCIKTLTAVVFSFFIFTGCSITNGTAKPPLAKEKAVVFVNDSLINVPKANMYFNYVDGKEISNFWSLSPVSKVTLDEGTHELIIVFYSNGFAGKTKITENFEKNRVYEVVAYKKRHNNFDIQLVDLTTNKKKILIQKKELGNWSP